ncbi:Sok2p [Sugiyamaella lignohabitans]|uniref:Sok2p n=1 Tax=Sugiyamaella lignohabitans TaxID=796027 RepID=A0A161HJ79_9ASCO|nr:Sok2p [Sugiyamaella lignohabitans]ANB11408.1 Sok2p [Sugiyamaella lignohabitans]
MTSYSQYPQYAQPQGQAQAGAANFYYGNSYQHPQAQQYYYGGNPSAPATGSSSANGSVTGSPATNTAGVTATGTESAAAGSDIAATYQQQGYYGTPLYQQGTTGSTTGQSTTPSSNQPHHQHLHHHIQQQQQQSQQIQAQTPYYNQYPPYMQQTHQGTAANAQYGNHSLQSQHSLVAQQHPQQQQHSSPQVAQTHQQPAVITDPTGQTAPPGSKPKVTTTLWEDEGTLCFQVEAKGICVARREDNDMINGTKLLNVAGMTRGRRDGILKGEKNRHVVKAGAMHLKGVWIPYERALDFANKEKIIDLLYPLFVTDIKGVLYHPANYARTAQVISAAAQRRKDLADAAAANSGSGSPTGSSAGANGNGITGANPGGVQSSQSYYYQDGRKEMSSGSPTGANRKLPQLPNPPSSASPSVIQGVQNQSATGSGNNDSYSTAPNSRVPTPNSNAFANGQQTQAAGQQTGTNEYAGSTTPLTDSVPHTPSSANLIHKTGQNQVSTEDDKTQAAASANNSSNPSPKIYGDDALKQE